MTSSSSFEIALTANGEEVLRLERDRMRSPGDPDVALEVDASSQLALTVGRVDAARRLRVRLGFETLAAAGEGIALLRTQPAPWFLNEFGESLLAVEEEADSGEGADDEAPFVPLFRILFQVRARPEVERDYRVMLEELERVHVALASDILGRTQVRRGFGPAGVRPLHAPELVRELENAERRLAAALAVIARQPSTALARERRASRWRPGDRTDSRLVAALAQAGVVPPNAGVPVRSAASLPVLRVQRAVSTTDIPEHRHLAEGLRALSRRAARVADRCRMTASTYRAAEARWGRRAGKEGSVFEERDLPRARVMDELAGRSERLATAFAGLLARSDFLKEAGFPRTAFGPTPLFLNRPAYREAYEALRDVSGPLGLLVDTGRVEMSLRNLATLYEYWCFIRVVESLRTRFGPAVGDHGQAIAEVYDDIYRPDLLPGQTIEFDGGKLGRVAVRYEPDFLPVRDARAHGARFAASLTATALRPDIVVEVTRGSESWLLLLDAKSTDAFTMEHLRSVADYLIQIHETGGGRQPARQLFLMHRDARARPACSLPGYLDGRTPGTEALVKGAVPAVPAQVGGELPHIENVLGRFFETVAPRRS